MRRRAVPASSSKPGKWKSKNMLEDEEEMGKPMQTGKRHFVG